jgi:Rrf2 family iron-sulfur cluster assembly transcriptional regulator
MNLSKSFGYALRGVLYVAIMNDSKPRVQLDEIAGRLAVPRHFLGKVLKKVVKAGILTSLKGPYGGFCINENTLQTKLLKLVEITGDSIGLDACVLRFRKCDGANPCPLHNEIEQLRKQWGDLLTTITLGDLLKKHDAEFIRSIAVSSKGG